MEKTVEFDTTKGLRINNNRPAWDEIYLEIRKLSVKKALKIKQYLQGKVSPQKVCVYRHGAAYYYEGFELLKPAHKAQVRKMMNQIESLYLTLREAQA